jgi:hypothetical protein
MRLARSSLVGHRLFSLARNRRWIQYKLDHDKILGVAVGQSTVN